MTALILQVFSLNDAEARRRRSRSRDPVIVHRLLNLKGTALIDGKPAPEFAGIKEVHLLETKYDSALTALMVGLGLFRLGENSQVKLQKFLNRDKFRMEALKGDVLIFIKRPGDHQVTAGDQIISITGEAIVRLKINAAHDAQVCSCKGSYKSSPKGPVKEASSSNSTSDTQAVTAQVCCKGIDLNVMDSLYQLP